MKRIDLNTFTHNKSVWRNQRNNINENDLALTNYNFYKISKLFNFTMHNLLIQRPQSVRSLSRGSLNSSRKDKQEQAKELFLKGKKKQS